MKKQAVIVSPDNYLLSESGEYVWSVPRVKAAWATATAKTEKLIASGRFRKLILMVGLPASGKSTWLKSHQEAGAIYFDATFTNAWRRKPYIEMAKAAGMLVSAVYMSAPLMVCMDRNSCRTVDRRVPDEALIQMATDLAGDPPTKAEGFNEVIKVNTPAARQAQAKNGSALPADIQKLISMFHRTGTQVMKATGWTLGDLKPAAPAQDPAEMPERLAGRIVKGVITLMAPALGRRANFTLILTNGTATWTARNFHTWEASKPVPADGGYRVWVKHTGFDNDDDWRAVSSILNGAKVGKRNQNVNITVAKATQQLARLVDVLKKCSEVGAVGRVAARHPVNAEVDKALNNLAVGPAGRLHGANARGTWWHAIPSHRQRLDPDTRSRDEDGASFPHLQDDKRAWEREYAAPMRAAITKALDRLGYGRGAFDVDVDSLGFAVIHAEDSLVESLRLNRMAKNIKVIEAPANHHTVEVQPPQAKRKEFPFEGFIDFQGLKIDVENVKGSTRRGEGPEGEWTTYMHCHYGEIRGTEGTDGDKLDVYVGDNHDSPIVVVIHQHNPWDGKFDEDKVMIGFDSIEAAIGAYKGQYDRPGFFKEDEFTAMPIGQFWRWVKDGRKKGKKVTGGGRTAALDLDPTMMGFGALLGVLRAVGWSHWTCHWQTSGEQSYSDHEMFDRIYGMTLHQTDQLAEKMVQKWGGGLVDSVQQAKNTLTALTGWAKEENLVKRALWAERSLLIALKSVRDAAQESGDLSMGMDNLLGQMADDHESNVYLLEQRLKTRTASVPMPSTLKVASRYMLKKVVAGWWAISADSPGGLDVPPPVDKGGLMNAIPGVDGADQALYNGDGPADIMDDAINRIADAYQESWGRKPYIEEMQAVWSFCGNDRVLADKTVGLVSAKSAAATEFTPEPRRRRPQRGEFEVFKGRGAKQKWFYLDTLEDAQMLVRLSRNWAFPSGITKAPISIPRGYKADPEMDPMWGKRSAQVRPGKVFKTKAGSELVLVEVVYGYKNSLDHVIFKVKKIADADITGYQAFFHERPNVGDKISVIPNDLPMIGWPRTAKQANSRPMLIHVDGNEDHRWLEAWGDDRRIIGLITRMRGLPTFDRNHVELTKPFPRSRDALRAAEKLVKDYRRSHFPGGSGEVIAMLHWDNKSFRENPDLDEEDLMPNMVDEYQGVVALHWSDS